MTVEVTTAGTELVRGAETARGVAAAHAAEAERNRRLSLEVAEALTDAGFARHFVPSRWGGTAGTFTEFVRAVAEVGEGCASAAWCGALYSILGRMASHLPEEAQYDIWGDGPDRRIVCSLTPAGRVEKVSGGWRLNGRWTFASAIHTADWALVGAVAPGAPGPFYFAVPRADLRIQDSWHNVGLRGTGSHTIVLDDVIVPEHRTAPVDRVWNGDADGLAARCHAVPLKAVNGLSFVAPALGSARVALAGWSAWIGRKTETTGRPAREKATTQLVLARSSAEIDAASLLLDRAAAYADEAQITRLGVSRSARDFSMAADLLVAAVDRLFRAGGARGQNQANIMERSWRDVNCAAGHFALQFEANAAAYAVQVFDLSEGDRR